MFHLTTKKKVWRTKRRNLLELLLVAIILTILLHIFWQLIENAVGAGNRIITDLAGRFGLDDEMSVPTWLASAMALLLFGLAFIVARAQSTGRAKVAWYLLSLLAVIISVDEMAALHELLLQSLHILAQFGDSQDFLRNGWLLVMPFALILVGLLLRFFAKSVQKQTVIRICIAVVVYLVGAAVVEYLSIRTDKSTLMYNLVIVSIEEGLELIGLWLLIRATLLHISQFEPKLRKQLTELISE